MRIRPQHVLAAALFVAALGCDKGKQPDPRPPDEGDDTTKVEPAPDTSSEGPNVLLRGAKVMTATGEVHEPGAVLVLDGMIAKVGPASEIEAPKDVTIVELAATQVLTPGIIDTHSHMGVYPSPGMSGNSDGNEAVAPNTAYVRAEDGVWAQDPQFSHALAGGVTAAQILPGSANLIGGRTFTIKLTPGARSAEDMRFPGAPAGLKMACGENPKRVYGEKGGPQTRMGNVAGYRKAFQAASEYQRQWDDYERELSLWETGKSKGADGKETKRPNPPARDFAMETLVDVLEGEILVHMHCYRADEMSLMLEFAASYGFSIRSFHHAVEAYKIADRLAEAGTSASIWADWWGFKAEAYDGIRENAALLHQAGGRPIIHSDSAEGIQRLNQEAAKAMFAGRRAGITISDDDALRWLTINPAWALGVDDQVGTLEPGKMADLVVWSGSPFSVYTRAEQVYIDGERVFDRAGERPRTDFDLGLRDDVRGAP